MGGGMTRNAVIGKSKRLGLEPRATKFPQANLPSRQKASKERQMQQRIQRALKPRPLLPQSAPGDMETLRGVAWEALGGSRPVALEATEAHQCRWPIGETAPFTFCGEPIHARSYCAAHYARAYRPVGTADFRIPKGQFKDVRLLDPEVA